MIQRLAFTLNEDPNSMNHDAFEAEADVVLCLCPEGLREYVDLPKRVKTFEVAFYARPGANRMKLAPYNWDGTFQHIQIDDDRASLLNEVDQWLYSQLIEHGLDAVYAQIEY